MKKCIRCFIEKPLTSFYFKAKGKYPCYYTECKVCMNTRNIARLIKLKLQAIEYKGGKCLMCGFQGNPRVFDFHHRDPTQKDFSIGTVKSRSFEKIKYELDKCDLLCSNCHREKHHRLAFESGSIDVKLYEGLLNQWFIPKTKQKFYCSCGCKMHRGANYCKLCAAQNQERTAWPSDEELAKLVWEIPRSKLALQLGVSDVAIAKRCKKRNISQPPRGYWSKVH